ncbi:MAG: hypothetical protein D6706_21705 [Chloroflexi bacterium]|nr:MAG: hypothetical protein D6706_21705 [Chloroflexota bacterium]
MPVNTDNGCLQFIPISHKLLQPPVSQPLGKKTGKRIAHTCSSQRQISTGYRNARKT